MVQPFSDSFRIRNYRTRKQLQRMLRTKVTSSLADTRPAIPHDEVMAEWKILLLKLL